jgi:hypothetical protein
MNTNYSAQLLSDPSLSSSIQQAGISVNNNLLLSLVDMWTDKVCPLVFICIHLACWAHSSKD